MKHKHCELIKAWADGAEIEERFQDVYAGKEWSEWEDFDGEWRESVFYEYRIKPEPKPDVVTYMNPLLNGDWREYSTPMCSGSIKIIRDGETGELKSAEVLK